MLILLNKELVMVEMLTWARLRIVEVLRIPEIHVKAEWQLNSLKQLVPCFTINEIACPEIDPKFITRVYKGVAHEMRMELDARLRGLKERRGDHGVQREPAPKSHDPRDRLVTSTQGSSSSGENANG